MSVLYFERFGKRLHAGEEQLFEAPCLSLHALFQALLITAVLDQKPAFFEGLGNARADLIEIERLHEVIHRADSQAADGDINVSYGGDEHDGRVRVLEPHLAQELNAVHLRHAQIGEHERDRRVAQHLYGTGTRRGLEALEAFAFHEAHEHLAQPRLVVDDEAAACRVAAWYPVHYLDRSMTRVFDDDLVARFATRAIHAGQRPDPVSGAVMTPIYQTSTFVQDGLGRHKGYEYARGTNPTRQALERNVAALKGGTHGFAFSSGMGCLDTIMKLFRSGDHIICGDNTYGGTFRLFDRVLEHFGLRFTFVDTRDPQRVVDAISQKTVAVLVETPTNPLMRITDLAAMAEIAHRAGALLIVDNTFATPFFQRPLEIGSGADIVYHSTTKYLNGHSDMVGGIAIVRDDGLAERLTFLQNAAGAVPGPFDSWLALRGTKTLHLRMPRHDANGQRIASWLVDRVGADRVIYPGLPSHPQHELAARQMSGFGGMISVDLGTTDCARKVLERVRVFSLAESLGGVESLISLPAMMTHASVPPERRAELGIGDGLIRLSCGVEDAEDLLEDLEQAFHDL